MTRYFIGFMITIGLIILLIFMLFRGGGNQQNVPKTSKPLASYATTDAQTIFTTEGIVNSNQEHGQIRIIVDRDTATYQEIRGYDGNVVDQHTYPNTQSAYTVFLLALNHNGFTQGNSSKDLADERGICALGNRYVFELRQGTSTIQRYWATTCSGTKTYNGNLSATIQLFQNQIPDYATVSQNVNLN
jgi:hypothetical protein